MVRFYKSFLDNGGTESICSTNDCALTISSDVFGLYTFLMEVADHLRMGDGINVLNSLIRII